MKRSPVLLALAMLLMAAGEQPLAHGDQLDVVDLDVAPEPYRTQDEGGQFSVSLAVEPLAGQSLAAAPFEVTLLPAPNPPPSIFSDGYESL